MKGLSTMFGYLLTPVLFSRIDRKPVCQEASDLINSGRCGMPADFMNNCFTTVAGGPIQQSHNCRDFLNMNDLVKVSAVLWTKYGPVVGFQQY